MKYLKDPVQPADIGWPTGSGMKLSSSQACCLAQLCLAAAQFLSISCGQSYVRRLLYAQRNKAQSIDKHKIHHTYYQNFELY